MRAQVGSNITVVTTSGGVCFSQFCEFSQNNWMIVMYQVSAPSARAPDISIAVYGPQTRQVVFKITSHAQQGVCHISSVIELVAHFFTFMSC